MAHKRDAVLKEKFWFRKNVFENERSYVMNGESSDAGLYVTLPDGSAIF